MLLNKIEDVLSVTQGKGFLLLISSFLPATARGREMGLPACLEHITSLLEMFLPWLNKQEMGASLGAMVLL